MFRRILLFLCLSVIFAQKGGKNYRADEDSYWYLQKQSRQLEIKRKAEGLLEYYKASLIAKHIEYYTIPYFQMIHCEASTIFNRNEVNSRLIAMNPQKTRSTKILEASMKNGNLYFVVDVGNGLSKNIYEAVIINDRAFLIYEEMTNCKNNFYPLVTSLISDKESMINISESLLNNYRLGINTKNQLILQDSLFPGFILRTCSNHVLARDELIRKIMKTERRHIQLSEFKIIDGFDVFHNHFTFMIYVSGSFIRFSVKYINDKNRYQFVSEIPHLCRDESSETTELVDPTFEDSKYIKIVERFWSDLKTFSEEFNEEELPKMASDSFLVSDCDDRKHKFLWFMDNILFRGYFKDTVIRSTKNRMITGNIDFEVKNFILTLNKDEKLMKAVCF